MSQDLPFPMPWRRMELLCSCRASRMAHSACQRGAGRLPTARLGLMQAARASGMWFGASRATGDGMMWSARRARSAPRTTTTSAASSRTRTRCPMSSPRKWCGSSCCLGACSRPSASARRSAQARPRAWTLPCVKSLFNIFVHPSIDIGRSSGRAQECLRGSICCRHRMVGHANPDGMHGGGCALWLSEQFTDAAASTFDVTYSSFCIVGALAQVHTSSLGSKPAFKLQQEIAPKSWVLEGNFARPKGLFLPRLDVLSQTPAWTAGNIGSRFASGKAGGTQHHCIGIVLASLFVRSALLKSVTVLVNFRTGIVMHIQTRPKMTKCLLCSRRMFLARCPLC